MIRTDGDSSPESDCPITYSLLAEETSLAGPKCEPEGFDERAAQFQIQPGMQDILKECGVLTSRWLPRN